MSRTSQRAARQARRRLKLGENPECAACAERAIDALEARVGQVVCYECARAREGRPTRELHHLVGRTINPELKVLIPGNLHRLLDAAKTEWEPHMRRLIAHKPVRRLVRLRAELSAGCDLMDTLAERYRLAIEDLDPLLEFLGGSSVPEELTGHVPPPATEEGTSP